MKKISFLRFSCIGIIIIILLSSIGCETNTNPENTNNTTDSSVESNTVESNTEETPKSLKQVAEENPASLLGVFSAGAMAGYTSAMDRHNVNALLDYSKLIILSWINNLPLHNQLDFY